jgi:hypothetical protein
MAIKAGPRTNSSSLVLYLDAANYRSYSGSGTTWNDLSSSNNTSSLVNGPSYSSSNNGYISFDGANDYISVNSNANILSKTEYTKIAYFYVTTFSTANNIISGGVSGQHAFWLFVSNKLYAGHNGAWSTVTGTTTLSLNTWYFGATTYSSTTGWKLYLNGVEDGSSVDTTTFTGNQEILVGAYGAGNYFTGRIGLVQVYNRALTASEILKNYNSTKKRYGL